MRPHVHLGEAVLPNQKKMLSYALPLSSLQIDPQSPPILKSSLRIKSRREGYYSIVPSNREIMTKHTMHFQGVISLSAIYGKQDVYLNSQTSGIDK